MLNKFFSKKFCNKEETDLEILQSHVETIESSLEIIVSKLDDILSRKDKTFTAKYKGELFDLHPSSTLEESTQMAKKRMRFIKKVLSSVVARNILRSSVSWDDILAFAMGPDPKHFQFKKIKLGDISNAVDEKGNKITPLRVTCLPLNEDSIYVKMQDARNDK